MIKEAIIKLSKKQDLAYAEAEAVMDDMSRPRPSSIIKLEKGGVIKIIRE